MSGLYYKHVTIVNDNYSIINKLSFKLIDDPRAIIYDRHTFMIQATDLQIVHLADAWLKSGSNNIKLTKNLTKTENIS